MSTTQAIVSILIAGAVTVLLRALPFWIFNAKRPLPLRIARLGQLLPPAVFMMLVVYCLRNVSLTTSPFGIPELVASGVTILIHLWRKNLLLSISIATIVCMVLVQVVFH